MNKIMLVHKNFFHFFLHFFQLYVTGLKSLIKLKPAVEAVMFSFNLSSEEAAHDSSEPFKSSSALPLALPIVILLSDVPSILFSNNFLKDT